MELQVEKEYRYVTFLNASSNKIDETREIVSSSQVNNEMLSMMLAKNYDESVIVSNLIPDIDLTKEEFSILSSVGCFQIDQSNLPKIKYEFTTLLNQVNLVVIKIPKDCMFVHLQVDKDVVGDIVDVTQFTTSNKLLFLAYSPNPIPDISSEIHNNMINPHYFMNKIVLFHSEKDCYELCDVIDTNLYNMQSETRMGDRKVTYEKSIDTEYLGILWDNSYGGYVYNINNKSNRVR